MRMLMVKDITFGYGSNALVLDNISFQVTPGKLCGLFGPNGCGKSTLFRCCLKFLHIQGGVITIDDTDISKISVRDLAKLVSYVPQEHKPPFSYLVKEVVLMGRTPHLGGVFGISAKEKKKAYEAMELVGITALADVPYSQLSVGQRQLVIIARAVAQETNLLFLDEPTSALDFRNQVRVWQLLRKLSLGGRTIVACTHDPNHVMWFCDEVVMMGEKGIIATGSPQKILSEKTLDKIYKDVCRVAQDNGMRMVYPSSIKSDGH
jgi:iron complex transport system ATP-binding protein